MTVFGNYARYYDLLYRDKDYGKEARFVHSLVQKYAPAARSLLELGCGTCLHAVELARLGYLIHGVDQSSEMLERAARRLEQLAGDLVAKISISAGDLRTVRLNRTFDVVVALFHVISYQPTNQDLRAAFASAKAHLRPGGLFLFDCWYGPGVLTDPPVVRVKRWEDERIHVTRIAEPLHHPNENWIDVRYHCFIKDKDSGTVEEIRETHRMRYLFSPEVKDLLEQAGLQCCASGEWLSEEPAGLGSWNAWFAALNS